MIHEIQNYCDVTEDGKPAKDEKITMVELCAIMGQMTRMQSDWSEKMRQEQKNREVAT